MIPQTSRFKQSGSAYLIVLVIVTALTILANFLFNFFYSHTKARKAHESYLNASQKSAATMDIVCSWLAAQQNPPELNLSGATTIRGHNTTVDQMVKSISESNIAGSDFYWFSFNNDGNDDAGLLILPENTRVPSDCGAGYDPGCGVEHSYLVISRSTFAGNTVVEHKRRVTKFFY